MHNDKKGKFDDRNANATQSSFKDEWLKARVAHLAAEKEFTRKRDELSRQRRELPWERVEKNYVFDAPEGPRTLADLFEGRQSTDRAALHVSPRLGGRLQELFFHGRQHRRDKRASGPA